MVERGQRAPARLCPWIHYCLSVVDARSVFLSLFTLFHYLLPCSSPVGTFMLPPVSSGRVERLLPFGLL